jgi:hypothetical protein
MDQNKLFKYGFLLTLATTVVLYFILDRKGKTLKDVVESARLKVITDKLMDLTAESTKSEDDYVNAYKKYQTLLNMYPDITNKLGLRLGPPNEQ